MNEADNWSWVVLPAYIYHYVSDTSYEHTRRKYYADIRKYKIRFDKWPPKELLPWIYENAVNGNS